MLVLHTKKQEQKDFERAIEESKFEAGLPNDVHTFELDEEEQLMRAIEISKQDALELVKIKS
jgi:hypothetical protein